MPKNDSVTERIKVGKQSLDERNILCKSSKLGDTTLK